MKVKHVLEMLNDMPLEDDLIVQWYSKQDVENVLNKKVSRESWEHITEWAADYVSMEDFGVSTLLERSEQDSE
jgi:hypothetical protein